MLQNKFILWDLRDGISPQKEHISTIYNSIEEAKKDYRKIGKGYVQALTQLWQIGEDCAALLNKNLLED